MRDSNAGMIEIVDAVNLDNTYSAIIGLKLDMEFLSLRFEVSESDYPRIRNIVTFRPFENTAVGIYHYFFSGSYQKNTPKKEMAIINIRVEQLNQHKQFNFPISVNFVANLLWFGSVKEKSEVDRFIPNPPSTNN